MTEGLYINGEAVDLKPDAATTLNYKSNLLGDISKITSSNSQTIQCPKTTRNRKIFDNPGAPAYVSDKRYNRYSARLVRNGIEVVRVGYAVLLSSSETYEIALYWGVMANFQTWVDKAAKLNELTGTEALTWNANTTATTLSQMKSTGYGFAKYDCGVSNASLANFHPSATTWWILDKITKQAGFTFEMPSKYASALRAIAIPCLSKKASPESWDSGAFKGEIYARLTSESYMGLYYIYYWAITVHSTFQSALPFYKGETGITTGGKRLQMSYFSTCGCKKLRIKIQIDTFPEVANMGAKMSLRKHTSSDTWYETNYKWSPTVGGAWMYDIDEVIDCSDFDEFCIGLDLTHNHSTSNNGSTFAGNIEIYAHDEEITYPSAFSIAPNLPEISQIDFIKAICGMFGIFAVPDPTNVNNLKFVSLDTLQENKAQACDWSDKFVRSNDDEPKTTEYKINDYCRNNYFKYKEDDTVFTNADGNLKIDSEILDAEKTVITLPFAPSDGSTIRHYELNDDGTAVDTVQVKDRIMRLISDGSGLAMLAFDDLDFTTLLSKYYSTLSRLLNSAITITEQIMLDEYDLKSLDYSIPFYLRQYGKFYGIVSIQSTANKACEVKAVQLPETVVQEPERPSQAVSIGWQWEDSAIYITASAAPASDLDVVITPYTYDGVALVQQTIIFPAGQMKVIGPTITQIVGGIEINSITPEYDDTYSYIIAEQTTKNA